MYKKLLLASSLTLCLNLNANESFLDTIKHKTSSILGNAKQSVDDINTTKIQSTVTSTYDKTSKYITKLKDSNTSKKLQEKTINSYEKLKVFTKQSIDYSKTKLESLSK